MFIDVYKKGDYYKITDPVESFVWDIDEEMVLYGGVAATGSEDGIIMACGGVVYTDTEGIVWARVDKKCSEHPIKWARGLKEMFAIMMDCLGDIDIYTYIVRDFKQGDRLARSIRLFPTDETIEYNGNVYTKYRMR